MADEQMTADDLEVARQAAKASRVFAKIHEVAEKAHRLTADLVSHQGELATLERVLAIRRAEVETVAAQLRQLEATRQREETSLRQVQERVAREAHEVAETAARLKAEWATDLEAATQAHRARLEALEADFARRQTELEETLHSRQTAGEAVLATLEKRIAGIQKKAQALAGQLVSPTD